MQLAARTAIRLARKSNLYIVIDADGLFLIQSDPSVIQGYKRAVLTPNVVEFKRLCDAVQLKDDGDAQTLAPRLADKLGGVTIVQKGEKDLITNGSKGETLVNEVEGSVRRCGGQGDVLSGAVGCFLGWGKKYEERDAKNEECVDLLSQSILVADHSMLACSDPIKPEEITLLAAYAASTVTRTASKLTFAKLKRAMQTSDMLNEVGPAFEDVFPEAVKEESAKL